MAPSLYDIFYNPLLLHLIVPHLSLSDRCAILKTCKGFRTLFLENGSLYSYLDLKETTEKLLARILMSAEDLRDFDNERNEPSFDEYDHKHAIRLSSSPPYNLTQLGEYVTLPPKYIHTVKFYKGEFYGFPNKCQGIPKNELISRIYDRKGIVLGSAQVFRYLIALSHIHVRFIQAILNAKIENARILQHVRVLVLDNVSIPVRRVICDILKLVRKSRSPLSLLSVRGEDLYFDKFTPTFEDVVDLNRRTSWSAELSQRHLGIYIFGPTEPTRPSFRRLFVGSDQKDGEIKEGSSSINRDDGLVGTCSSTVDIWYKSYGSVLGIKRALSRQDWAQFVYQLCNHNTLGFSLAFDAVLCRGPRHDEKWVKTAARLNSSTAEHSLFYLSPDIASVALGPDGCVKCGTSPEGPASYQSSPVADLPLLAPIPRLNGTSVRDAQRLPLPLPEDSSASGCQRNAKLIVRCHRCLDGRWCERCNCWWCENCFPVSPAKCDQPNHELFSFDSALNEAHSRSRG